MKTVPIGLTYTSLLSSAIREFLSAASEKTYWKAIENISSPTGRIVLLPEEWFSKYANLLEAGKESDKTIRLKRPFIGVIESILEKDRQSTSIKNAAEQRNSRTHRA